MHIEHGLLRLHNYCKLIIVIYCINILIKVGHDMHLPQNQKYLNMKKPQFGI